MVDSFQKQIPSSRINISVDLHSGCAQKKVELPLKLLIAGDFSAGKLKDPLKIAAQNTLAADGSEPPVSLSFRAMKEGGKVEGQQVHLYYLGAGVQPKIPTEVLIPETREFEFAGLGFIPLSFYKNHDYACFSANPSQKPAQYETKEATANGRINARLPYIFLLSRIAHYLELIPRESIGTTKDPPA